MRAAQIVAPGRVEIVDAAIPGLKPGHALVRPRFLSICGSDIHMLHHMPPEEYPCPVGTSGHEMVGVIEAIEAPGSDLKVGDLTLTLAPQHEAMAEYYLAPVGHILPLPAGRPLTHLLMAQQLGTVIYACKQLPNLLGKDVVVIGQGSAGLYFDFIARRMGARRVIGLDLKAARSAAGHRFGATHAVNNSEIDALEAVEQLTDGTLADVVIEAAGEIDTINMAPHLARANGHLLYFGIPRAHIFNFDFYTFFRKRLHTTSEVGAPSEPGLESFKQALALIADGHIDVAPLLTHQFPFEQVADAYELARTRDDNAIKVVVEMS